MQVDNQQVFQLLDRILPFEACLYHQILPLSLEGSCLHLGMVTLEDSTALDYVRRILAFMSYSLVPQTITSEVHYAVLSAYLNHTGSQQQAAAASVTEASAQASPEPDKQPLRVDDQHLKATLVLDDLDELDEVDLPDFSARRLYSPFREPVDSPPHDRLVPPPQSNGDGLANSPNSNSAASALPTPGEALPTLSVTTQYLDSAPEVLAALHPTQLLQELLGRILRGGIGRLYFERQADSGRILWSQNGVVQSVLSNLPLTLFQAVIDELKKLTHLPLTTVQTATQVEIERVYQKNRLLLRLRIMITPHGEEATLQILRGAALKFHQQQQLTSLSRDALSIAQELQQKVHEIRDRTRSSSQALDSSTVVPNLSEVLKLIEQQLEDLKRLQNPEKSEE